MGLYIFLLVYLNNDQDPQIEISYHVSPVIARPMWVAKSRQILGAARVVVAAKIFSGKITKSRGGVWRYIL